MRLPYVRFTPRRMILLALGATAISAVFLVASLPSPAQATPPARMTLLGTLSEWKYPGSTMLDGASMSDGGNSEKETHIAWSHYRRFDTADK